MINGMKNGGEVSVQLAEIGGAVSGSSVMTDGPERNVQQPKTDVMYVVLRLACVLTAVTAVSLMTTAKQASTISIYGFSIPLHSKWSFSDSFEYLVGVTAAVAVHSLLQLLIGVLKLLKKSPIIPSRTHAWLIFAADQVFAYALMSAGSAASGVTNLNRTGIHHSGHLPNFCKPLHSFCDRVAVSIAFTFFSCFILATSVVLDAVWLSKY